MTRAPAGPRLLAWFGATLFATSLLYFLFSYAVTFREITPGRPDAAVIAANVALFVAFAGHHSLFARTSLRAWVARAVSPSLERTVYVVIASLMLIGVCLLWQPVPGVAWQARPPLSWLLLVAQVAGVWLTLRSAAIIDIWDLAGVRQASKTPNVQLPTPKPDRSSWELEVGSVEFKTEGPYGWVRHPIYLGWFLLVLPVATMTMTRLVFAAVSCAYVLIAIPLEERELRRATGGAYGEYIRKVPWKLVPYVY